MGSGADDVNEPLLLRGKRGAPQDDGAGNPKFKKNLQLAVRGTFWATVLASIIWVPMIRDLPMFTKDFEARLPLTVLLYMFTINPILGQCISNSLVALLGTLYACFHIWVMMGIFPGGVSEGDSPTSAVSIFGHLNFLIFTWLFLWTNCGGVIKVWFLSYDIWFMLCFVNPKDASTWSTGFGINFAGTAMNCVFATIIAIIFSLLMNLVPYMMTSAFTDMKQNALKSSADAAILVEEMVEYYSGNHASVVIENLTKRMRGLRSDLDGMGSSIGLAWYEGFDMGSRGHVRALHEAHLGLLNQIYDRFANLLKITITSEDFGKTHTDVMARIGRTCLDVVQSSNDLLMFVTKAAGDGRLDQRERDRMQELVAHTKDAVKALVNDFNEARRGFRVLQQDLMQESFFVLSISAYARSVCEYSDQLIATPAKPVPLSTVIINNLKSTWSFADMMEKNHMLIACRYYLAFVIGWIFAINYQSYGTGTVVTIVFLMNTRVFPDIQATLNLMNAIIISVVSGSIVFNWGCQSGHGAWVLPLATIIIWLLGLYTLFSGSALSLVACFVVAIVPLKTVAVCPEPGSLHLGASALWGSIVAFCLAILLTSICEMLFSFERSSDMAVDKLDAAFKQIKVSFATFWKHGDTTKDMAPVSGILGEGEAINGSAKIEPRFWRLDWKGGLYDELIATLRQLRLDILMINSVMAGPDGVPDGLFGRFEKSPAFQLIQDDLSTTLDDAHRLALKMLKHVRGHFLGLEDLKTTTQIDVLQDLPQLVKFIQESGGLKFPSPAEVAQTSTLEDDDLCQISAVFIMLDATVKCLAAMLKSTIKTL